MRNIRVLLKQLPYGCLRGRTVSSFSGNSGNHGPGFPGISRNSGIHGNPMRGDLPVRGDSPCRVSKKIVNDECMVKNPKRFYKFPENLHTCSSQK